VPNQLPPPATAVELYLVAILEELRAIGDRLDRPQLAPSSIDLSVPAEGGAVRLEEPRPPALPPRSKRAR